MLKKLIPLLFLAIIFTVTYQVTRDTESAGISAIKEKLRKKIEEEKSSEQKKASPGSASPISSPIKKAPEPNPSLVDDNASSSDPFESKTTVTKKVDGDTKDSNFRKRRQKRIFPDRENTTSASTAAAPDRPQSSPSMAQGAEGSVTSGASQRTFVVTENGEGESYLLLEALRMLRSGDKLQVRKGTYTFLMNHLAVPDVDITGEGEETIIEIPETLRVQQRNLILKKLRLLNTGTSSAIEVTNGKRITANDVTLIGNGNDCISVIKGDATLTNVRLERCNRALLVREATPQLNQLVVNDSDYGIYFAGNAGFGVTGLKAETINLFSVFFTSESSGTITCTGCRLTENATNRRTRLLIKQ